jgi:hypothetical protein
MLRFLIIFGLIAYVVYKVGSFFFKAGAASQQLRDQQRRNVDNNKVRADADKKKPSGSNGKVGEYIDYEEIK